MSETKIFSHEFCGPCHEVVEQLEKQGNQINGEPVRVVDVATDEGFEEFQRDVLSKGDGAVPAAFRNGQQCQLYFDNEDHVGLRCPGDEVSSPLDAAETPSDPPEPEPS